MCILIITPELTGELTVGYQLNKVIVNLFWKLNFTTAANIKLQEDISALNQLHMIWTSFWCNK